MPSSHRLLSSLIVAAWLLGAAAVHAQTNLGMVALKNANNGNYMQGKTNGEVHVSNANRHEEETWFLIDIDKSNHLYAIQNWRTGKYLSIDRECPRATGTALGDAEKWELISGKPYGVLNAVVIRSHVSGQRVIGIGAAICGGEAATPSGLRPGEPPRDSRWPGYWVMESVGAPSRGPDFWNTVGGAFNGIANKIAPIALEALFAALGI